MVHLLILTTEMSGTAQPYLARTHWQTPSSYSHF